MPWQGRFAGPVYGLILVTAATLAHCPENIDRGKTLTFADKKVNTLAMENIDLSPARVLVRRKPDVRYRLNQVFLNRLAPYRQETIAQVTTRRLSAPVENGFVSQPLLPQNDWQGRGLRWATLVPPFRHGDGGRGSRLLCVRGRVDGQVRVTLAVAELAPDRGNTALETVLEPDPDGTLCRCLDFTVESIGKTHLLARLDRGNGALRLSRLAWYPVNGHFMRVTGLIPPCAENQ